MTLADAMHALATAGCRLMAGHDGGIALDVPPGRSVAREVLDVLAAHREAVAAALTPTVPEAGHGSFDSLADLRDYLASKMITARSAAFVEQAVTTFGIRTSAVAVEVAGDPEPTFFEDGLPVVTVADTKWHDPGRGYFTIPAGTTGLAIPQTWAIADDFDRRQLEALLERLKKNEPRPHVPVWLEGRARAVEATAIVTLPDVPAGMNLTPWRTRPTPEDCSPCR